MDSIFTDVNPIVVFVAAVIAYLFGGLWYSPWGVGRYWKDVKAPQADKKKDAHLWSFVMTVIASYAMTLLVNNAAIDTLGDGLMLGAICWAGFMAPAAANAYLWRKTDGRAAAANAGYQLAATLIMAGIATIWY